MGIFIAILILILAVVVFNWLSKQCARIANDLSQEKAQEAFYKKSLLEATQNIERAVTPIKEETDSVQALLSANQEIIEKRKVKDAIERELGVEMRSQ